MAKTSIQTDKNQIRMPNKSWKLAVGLCILPALAACGGGGGQTAAGAGGGEIPVIINDTAPQVAVPAISDPSNGVFYGIAQGVYGKEASFGTITTNAYFQYDGEGRALYQQSAGSQQITLANGTAQVDVATGVLLGDNDAQGRPLETGGVVYARGDSGAIGAVYIAK